MLDSLGQRLARAADRVREFEGIGRRREELRRRGDELAGQVQVRRGEAEAEGAEVERLERLTLTRVLASVRGSREDRLGSDGRGGYVIFAVDEAQDLHWYRYTGSGQSDPDGTSSAWDPRSGTKIGNGW